MSAETGVEGLSILVAGGASGGLGRVVADGLVEMGANVVGTSRSGEGTFDGPTTALDLTDPRSIESALDEVIALHGRIDGVVNAAGITHRADMFETRLEDWNRVVALNLTGAFALVQAAAKRMLANSEDRGDRGSIVNFASLCASRACDGVVAYSASKAGVIGLTRSAASELAPHRIRVNCLTPGVFVTPLNESIMRETPRGVNALRQTPAGRFGQPEELCGAVALLVGRRGSFITGTEIVVDGGFSISGLTERGGNVEGS